MNTEAMRVWLAGIEDVIISVPTDDLKKNWEFCTKTRALEALSDPPQGIVVRFHIEDWGLHLCWNCFTNCYYGYIPPDKIPLGKGTFYNEAHFHNLYNLSIPTDFAKMIEALNGD